MSSYSVDTVARRAATAISRRHSLLTLGGAVLAATVPKPSVSEAKKKSRKDCQKKEQQRCTKDFAACRNMLLAKCGGTPACVTAQACCATCSATGYLSCVLASV